MIRLVAGTMMVVVAAPTAFADSPRGADEHVPTVTVARILSPTQALVVDDTGHYIVLTRGANYRDYRVSRIQRDRLVLTRANQHYVFTLAKPSASGKARHTTSAVSAKPVRVVPLDSANAPVNPYANQRKPVVVSVAPTRGHFAAPKTSSSAPTVAPTTTTTTPNPTTTTPGKSTASIVVAPAPMASPTKTTPGKSTASIVFAPKPAPTPPKPGAKLTSTRPKPPTRLVAPTVSAPVTVVKAGSLKPFQRYEREVGREQFERALDDFHALAKQLTLTKLGSRFAVKKVSTQSLLFRMGLRKGDVIETVAGKRILTMDDAALAYVKVLSAPSFTVQLRRGGQTLEYVYSFR